LSLNHCASEKTEQNTLAKYISKVCVSIMVEHCITSTGFVFAAIATNLQNFETQFIQTSISTSSISFLTHHPWKALLLMKG
jgi:hypothetical protein